VRRHTLRMFRAFPVWAARLAAPAVAASTVAVTMALTGCTPSQAAVVAKPSGTASAASAPSSVAPRPSASPSPSPSPTPPPSLVNLKVGSKGDAVTLLQQRLTALGYWTGQVDGNFGDVTQQAVFALQKAAGLPRSGTVTAETEAALNAGTRPTARSTSGKLIEVDLAHGLLLFVSDGHVDYALNDSTGGGYVYYQDGQRDVAITPKGKFTTYRVVNGPDRSPLGLLIRPRYFYEGFAIHGDDYVPAQPVSHGCVRVTAAAIDWIWDNNLDPIGTTVWIY
jgi:peptidoglycan hydrolase-like protein with peptidoglycan-binding domain